MIATGAAALEPFDQIIRDCQSRSGSPRADKSDATAVSKKRLMSAITGTPAALILRIAALIAAMHRHQREPHQVRCASAVSISASCSSMSSGASGT